MCLCVCVCVGVCVVNDAGRSVGRFVALHYRMLYTVSLLASGGYDESSRQGRENVGCMGW